MSKHIHRTAVFTIHNPTRRTKAILDHAFSLYTQAYTTVLHYFSQYGVDELHAMATYAIDGESEQKTSTRQLVKNLFCRESSTIDAALLPLEGSMRASLKIHVAETLLSYVALSLDPKQTPSYPERLRPHDLEPSRMCQYVVY